MQSWYIQLRRWGNGQTIICWLGDNTMCFFSLSGVCTPLDKLESFPKKILLQVWSAFKKRVTSFSVRVSTDTVAYLSPMYLSRCLESFAFTCERGFQWFLKLWYYERQWSHEEPRYESRSSKGLSLCPSLPEEGEEDCIRSRHTLSLSLTPSDSGCLLQEQEKGICTQCMRLQFWWTSSVLGIFISENGKKLVLFAGHVPGRGNSSGLETTNEREPISSMVPLHPAQPGQ